MPNVKVAIWTEHPHDILGEAINFVTHGIAQHAGFIRGNGQVHELYLPKVRDRVIAPGEEQYIQQLDIIGLTYDMNVALERHFDDVLAASITDYSVEDLFRIVLNIPKPADGSMVCSQYVFWQLAMIKLPPCARCNNDFISPRDIYISLGLAG